jgi:hypothetical protein
MSRYNIHIDSLAELLFPISHPIPETQQPTNTTQPLDMSTHAWANESRNEINIRLRKWETPNEWREMERIEWSFIGELAKIMDRQAGRRRSDFG